MASRSGPRSQAGAFLRDAHLDIAAELDVGAAAGHVGRDRDRARHAGFGDDIGFLLVEARVQHGEQFRGLAGARRRIELLSALRLGEIDLPIALAPASNSASCSDFSIDVVPTSIGCILALAASISRDDGAL